ncbi:MAG: hydroxyproline-2-epimerase [Planctomycetota bacterium]|nr:MAG: hydroxyproline-2-epimerase [Planctomycetota bacterium]
MIRIPFIDTHTGGEPTRVLLQVPLAERITDATKLRRLLQSQHDWMRRATILPPRGNPIIVGALVAPPPSPECSAGVVFFNNAGYLGMCGHGTIGLMVALHAADRVPLGSHRIDTPVGQVQCDLLTPHRVRFENVLSYRSLSGVPVTLGCGARVVGDVAWGGNWFFICHDHGQQIAPDRAEALTQFCMEIRQALRRDGIQGEDGAEIDHIELVGPATDPERADARNFVLCPGGEFDRSPCGTGTSAKIACLAADGKLAPGEVFRQESICGSIFRGSYRLVEGGVLPSIEGDAFVTARGEFILDPQDPFRLGLPV